MSRVTRCRVCQHATKTAIEAACATASTDVVAALFGLSELALAQHLDLHQCAPAGGAVDEVLEEAPATSRSPVFDAPPVSARLPRVVLEVLEAHPEAKREVFAALEREVAA